jgi:hypothetical protein
MLVKQQRGRVCRFRLGAEVAEDLPDDVALDAADDLGLALSLGRAPAHVVERWLVAAHAGDHDPVKGGVGLAVAGAVEPVPVGLAAGCRDRANAALGSGGRHRVPQSY